MWDLKLLFNDFFFSISFFLYDSLFTFFNFIDPFLHNGLYIFNSKNFYQFPQNMSFFFGIKFCFCISLLVLVRGGLPRYRYDYLTKLGWLKFLTFIIFVFFSSLLIFFLF